MGSILDIINVPIGYLMRWCYDFTSSYGLAIILVAIITKLLLLPLGVKQHKSQLTQMKYRPRVAEIQKKYANDQARMQREMQKLQAEGYKPAAGCGTLLLQFPIMIGIYNVIRHPLKYIVNLSDAVLDKIAGVLQGMSGFESITTSAADFEITAITQISANPGAFAEALEGTGYFAVNMDFLGLNLAAIPEKINYFLSGILPIPTFATLLCLIPIISALTAALNTIITQKLGPSKYLQDPNMQQGKGTMMIMNILGPYMSYAIAFAVPAGLGVYWICSNILMGIQTVALNTIYSPKKFIEQMQAEEEARKQRKKKKKVVMEVAPEDVIEIHDPSKE